MDKILLLLILALAGLAIIDSASKTSYDRQRLEAMRECFTRRAAGECQAIYDKR